MKSSSAARRVLHQKYGHGTVVQADSQYTTIEFDQHGIKKFVTEIVSLQPSSEPPPPRRRGGRKAKQA
ncbi:MAG: hypothetical protein ACE5JI_03895 [Acidobacteriota bacterium]